MATVVQPLKDLYAGQFDVAPYAVLFKPSHGLRILAQRRVRGFSPKAAYIFRKQLEEADAIVINRIDELTAAELDGAQRAWSPSSSPARRCCVVSAKTGQGFDAVAELLDQDGEFGRKILDIDYDIYAEGEAELGWLNSSVRVPPQPLFARSCCSWRSWRACGSRFADRGGEVAHLKVIGTGGRRCVRRRQPGQQPARAGAVAAVADMRPKAADLIVNARVAIDPVDARRQVQRIVADVVRGAESAPSSARPRASAPAGRRRRIATPWLNNVADCSPLPRDRIQYNQHPANDPPWSCRGQD